MQNHRPVTEDDAFMNRYRNMPNKGAGHVSKTEYDIIK